MDLRNEFKKQLLEGEVDNEESYIKWLEERVRVAEVHRAESEHHKAVCQLTDYLNSFSNKREFNDRMANAHRTLQQNFTKLCMDWIKFNSKREDRFYDPRNKQTQVLSQKIMKLLDGDYYLPHI